MKTFSIITIIALIGMTLAAGNCPKGSCVSCAYNTTDKANYCESCAFKTLSGDAMKTTCSGSMTVDNCLAVSYKVADTDATPMCVACMDGYWHVDNKCFTCDIKTKYGTETATGVTCTDRTTIDGCKTYSRSSDRCSECESGKDTHDLGKKCGTLPSKCLALQFGESTAKCSICDSGSYSNAGTCEDATAIANCELYATKTTCMSCKNGFISKSTECAAAPITHCSSLDGDKCDGCESSETVVRTISTDKKTCVDTTKCMSPKFEATGTTFKCMQCRRDVFNGARHWATDVVGTSKAGTGSDAYWDQECTRSAAIKSLMVVMVAAFAALL